MCVAFICLFVCCLFVCLFDCLFVCLFVESRFVGSLVVGLLVCSCVCWFFILCCVLHFFDFPFVRFAWVGLTACLFARFLVFCCVFVWFGLRKLDCVIVCALA